MRMFSYIHIGDSTVIIRKRATIVEQSRIVFETREITF
jgi:hypothetical protein